MAVLDPWLWLVQAAITWYLVGLIWLVQRVEYPLLAHAAADFAAAHREHMRRIAPVVGIPMLLEVACAILWLVVAADVWSVLNLTLLAVVWAATVGLAMPCHRRLERAGHDPATLRRLVRSNWLRTAAWSAKGAVVLVPLGTAMLGSG